MRKGVTVDTLNSFENVQIAKNVEEFSLVSEKLFCHNVAFNLYRQIVNDITGRKKCKIEKKDLFQTPAKKVAHSVCGGNKRKCITEKLSSVTEHCVNEIFDQRITEWRHLKILTFLVKMEEDKEVDDQQKAEKNIFFYQAPPIFYIITLWKFNERCD